MTRQSPRRSSLCKTHQFLDRYLALGAQTDRMGIQELSNLVPEIPHEVFVTNGGLLVNDLLFKGALIGELATNYLNSYEDINIQ